MRLSAQTIRERVRRTQAEGVLKFGGPQTYDLPRELRFNIEPFCEPTTHKGMSYGLSGCGYDIRIGQIDRTKADVLNRTGKSHLIKHSSDADQKVSEWLVAPGEFVLLSSL